MKISELRSKTIKGLLNTADKGYREFEMTEVPLDSHKEANKRTFKTMGFKIVYGWTGEKMIEFVRAGDLRKKDLDFMKQLGVKELVSHGCFAPNYFVTADAGTVKREVTIELGKETDQHMNRWLKAIWGESAVTYEQEGLF